MSGIWGDKIKLSIFGESHGRAIGITIDGIMPGVELDFNCIKREMARRAPGKSELSSSRREEDEVEIISGFFNGKTTGTPICALIYNRDQHSVDYESIKSLMRPSHADFTAYIRYNGFNDYRGGGHFSGRMTAPIVFAGAICKQILRKKGIIIGSHIKSIGEIEDKSFDMVSLQNEELEALTNSNFPLLDRSVEKEMMEAILNAKKEKDSLGGVVEAAIINIPAGIGSPFFDSVESRLAHLLFSIPSIKGVEFGAGFGITRLMGSSANDEFYIEDNNIRTYTNNNGGILGGITNGMPIIFRAAVKPTPSIGMLQNTVDIDKKENAKLEIRGRHDPCIVPRVLPVIEAAAAIAILDMM